MTVKQGGDLPVHILSTPQSLEDIAQLPCTTFEHDWFGVEPRGEAGFCAAIDPQHIHLSAYCRKTPCFDAYPLGAFAAELWKKDCAEIFIREDKSTRYQEFNLSPCGAWWSQLFSARRQADPENFKMPRGIKTFSKLDPDAWQAVISIPRAELSISCDFAGSARANVSMILAAPHNQYLSWAKGTSIEPDFHEVESYSKVLIIK